MEIKYTKSFDNTYKKLKKYPKEVDNLKEIIRIIERNNNFKILLRDNMAKMYGFERLKHFRDEYYSFNLGKNKGIIRLITEDKNDKCYFVYISFKHYKDFDERKVIYYD